MGNAEYEVKVKEVNIAPNPIARGEPATFTISANTWCGITGGKLVIEVTYFGWHIHSETHDLCSETSCPAETGDFLVAHSQVLPGYTPPVSLMIHFMFHLMPTPQGSFYVFNDIFRLNYA
ncbi:PREDICTED: phosphatidylglycerol/phosphatidylinositol transfer protein-like [Brassica oleracea var. oleracea]|uniref:phosphatidylglycerol/phosphatidylinositol transfer protein-like n=1 Tax=Brassica oleracea var. oleracea TaxID=109376 RepID=UPI0006A70E9F|nr:PREDICTED: phosphatidylglycerol/phosphatidylinositol transfer protein-like [Brassica oleracea var. oleracea]